MFTRWSKTYIFSQIVQNVYVRKMYRLLGSSTGLTG
jgi:hypothetical protein